MTVIMLKNMSIEMLSTNPQPRSGTRPQRSPPRNPDGEIVCAHPDCKSKEPTFRRLCEYNKHMDKHERPYKCSNPACKKSPGFTYAGGLLRHQREVHSMHRTKDPFFCPHSSCNRNTGSGFSRRENLEEHLRRRHSGISIEECAAAEPVTNTENTVRRLEPLPTNRKRQADVEADDERGLDVAQAAPNAEAQLQSQIDTLHQDNERLRTELHRRDRAISELSQEIRRLRQMLTPISPMPTTRTYQPPPLG